MPTPLIWALTEWEESLPLQAPPLRTREAAQLSPNPTQGHEHRNTLLTWQLRKRASDRDLDLIRLPLNLLPLADKAQALNWTTAVLDLKIVMRHLSQKTQNKKSVQRGSMTFTAQLKLQQNSPRNQLPLKIISPPWWAVEHSTRPVAWLADRSKPRRPQLTKRLRSFRTY